MQDIKSILWALVFVLLLFVWISNGCSRRIDQWREHRQEQQHQRQQRWDEWQQDRKEKWRQGRWRGSWRDRQDSNPDTELHT